MNPTKPRLAKTARAKIGTQGQARPKARQSKPVDATNLAIQRDRRRKKLETRYGRDVIDLEAYVDAAEFTTRVAKATPFERVELERNGVPGVIIKDLSRRMDISSTRIYQILGLPKATAEKKAASGRLIAGSGGHAAIGMARLIAMAAAIGANSTAPEARQFDAAKWLGQWIERPQPSLGGRKPADLLDTPTGVEIVARVLGASESGAYQ